MRRSSTALTTRSASGALPAHPLSPAYPNPSGRPKASKNFKTLLNEILNEQISLQEGSQSRKISKAEAIMRRLIMGALKGDTRHLRALFRLAEQTGQFNPEEEEQQIVEIVRFAWEPERPAAQQQAIEHPLPVSSQNNRDA
jgi:hypothetical protein